MIKQDDFEYDQHDPDKVYGLGVPKHPNVQIYEGPTPSEAPQGANRTNILTFRNPRIITQEALNAVAFGVMEARPDWTVPTSMETESKDIHFNVEHFCALVIHPTTGKLITKYTELAKDEEMRELWTTAFGKEWGTLAQGNNKTGAIGTNSLFVMTHE